MTDRERSLSPASLLKAPTPSDEPADVREARIERDGRVAIATLVISSFTDWLGIGCLTFLIAIGAIGGDFAYGIIALATGTVVSKMRGPRTPMGGAGTTALLIAAGPAIAKTAAAVITTAIRGA